MWLFSQVWSVTYIWSRERISSFTVYPPFCIIWQEMPHIQSILQTVSAWVSTWTVPCSPSEHHLLPGGWHNYCYRTKSWGKMKCDYLTLCNDTVVMLYYRDKACMLTMLSQLSLWKAKDKKSCFCGSMALQKLNTREPATQNTLLATNLRPTAVVCLHQVWSGGREGGTAWHSKLSC